MSKQIFVVAAVAAITLVFSSAASHAQVESFGYPAGGAACTTGCGNTNIAAQQSSFGYGQMSERLRATQDQNGKIYDRNAAWPKPFACASRQHYHNIWRPMYDAGWEDQCLLTGVHFDENGELTRYGRNQVSTMMMNMPRERRTIFVQELASTDETDARVAKVQDVVKTWFAQRGGMVQVSSRTAVTMSGVRAVDITDKATTAAPAPIIPIADGASGVSSSITQ